LVNYTILLGKRNDQLHRLKSILVKEQEAPDTPPRKLITNLIDIIDRNLSNRNDWLIFKTHFDTANSDFLEKLREMHNELSPSDLRLCGFLRMNLTSKEIASLLSISLRSVEVKRYRLRKKLHLEHDQNLIEYLLNV
jgi:DNA-binding CsgD family transcriptional regulator